MPLLPRSEPVSLSGRHLFVTGGTGFLGRSLLDYLTEVAARHGADFTATVLTREPQRFLGLYPEYGAQPWLDFVSGDLTRLPDSPRRFTDLVHAAANTRPAGNALEWLDQLVNGTRYVLDFARDKAIERVLFVSSGAVYGRQPADVAALTEDWPHAPLSTDPSSVYGNGKRLAEHLCTLYVAQYGMQCVIARCFAVLSEHVPLDGPFAAGNFLRDALTRDRILVHGDGNAIRTYMDGRDMAHWLTTLLRRGAAGDAYNVGSDMPLSTLDLARAIGAQLAPEKPIVVEHRSVDVSRSIYVPSVAKARQLGLAIETSLGPSIAAAAQGRLRCLR